MTLYDAQLIKQVEDRIIRMLKPQNTWMFTQEEIDAEVKMLATLRGH